jgi:subtilisin family serine protease
MLQVLVACAILFWALPPLAAQVQRVSVLVHLAEGTDRGPVRAFAAIQAGIVRYEYQVLPNVMNLRDIPAPAVAALRNMPGVLRVEEDIVVQAHLDESTEIIKALDSNLVALGGPDGTGVRVCIVDTGINKNHSAFANRVDGGAGYDFVNKDNDPNDDNGHGTHVAAIALGALTSYPGVARGATLIGVKVLNSAGGGAGSDVIAGIDHCAGPANADVINLSLGGGSFSGTCDSETIAVAGNNAVTNGVVVVASSGNSGTSNAMGSPACGSKVIAVGATYDEARGSASWCLARNFIRCTQSCTDNTAVDLVTCFSNKSDQLDVTAPGCYTTSANSSSPNDGVLDYCGTSQASPHVAGLAALLLDQDGSLTPAQVRQLIRDGAEDKGPFGFDPAYGHGRINAVNSLSLVGPAEPVTDIAITSVSAPSSVVLGDVVSVDVTVKNVGNQPVGSSFDVSLDATAGQLIGTPEPVNGLEVGTSTTRTFLWDTAGATIGSHTLTGAHNFSDGSVANNSKSTAVTVNPLTENFSLSAIGYKVKGLQKADLTWSGATSTNVDVYRNNNLIATTANDGSHTDNINAKGGGSYTYKVCHAGTSTCSNNVVVSF